MNQEPSLVLAIHPSPTPTTAAGWAEAAIATGLDAVLVVRARDWVIVFANPRCAELTGRALPDLVGQRAPTLLPTELRALHAERHRQYVQDPTPRRLGQRPPVMLRRPDGSTFPVDFSLAPFTTADGTFITVVLRPIAEAEPRMGTLQHLARSERAAQLGSWEEDGATGAVLWSEGLDDLLELPARTMRPNAAAFLDRVHPDDLARVVTARAAARERGGEWFVEARVAAGPGAERWITVSIVGFVELDADGTLIRSTGTVQNISARVLLERRLHDSDARLQAAFDSAPIGMMLIDARAGHIGTRLMVNQALAELAGHPRAELLVQPAFASIHPDDRATVGDHLARVISGEIPRLRSLECRLLHPDGWEHWISCSISLVRDDSAAPAFVIAHIVDITERRRSERERHEHATRDARIAQVLQDGLHPHVPDTVGPVRVAHRYHPAGDHERVGGDWSDVFALPGSRIGIVVGDVAGHGIEAAATMTRLRSLVRMLATSGTSPAGVMRRLNDALHESPMRADIDLATLVHAQLDPATGTLLYCSAGHLPMLVLPTWRAPYRRTVTPIPAIGGPPIGVVPGLRYTEETVALEPGGILIGYTDGLIEQRDQHLDRSILELQNRINALPSDTLTDVETLADAVLHQSLRLPAEDDVALLVLRFVPTPAGGVPRPVRRAGLGEPGDGGGAWTHPVARRRVDIGDVPLLPDRWTRPPS